MPVVNQSNPVAINTQKLLTRGAKVLNIISRRSEFHSNNVEILESFFQALYNHIQDDLPLMEVVQAAFSRFTYCDFLLEYYDHDVSPEPRYFKLPLLNRHERQPSAFGTLMVTERIRELRDRFNDLRTPNKFVSLLTQTRESLIEYILHLYGHPDADWSPLLELTEVPLADYIEGISPADINRVGHLDTRHGVHPVLMQQLFTIASFVVGQHNRNRYPEHEMVRNVRFFSEPIYVVYTSVRDRITFEASGSCYHHQVARVRCVNMGDESEPVTRYDRFQSLITQRFNYFDDHQVCALDADTIVGMYNDPPGLGLKVFQSLFKDLDCVYRAALDKYLPIWDTVI